MSVEPVLYLSTTSGAIKFTEEGRAILGPYLAINGLSIDQIQTRQELHTAMRTCDISTLDDALSTLGAGRPSVERELAIALLASETEAEADAIMRRIQMVTRSPGASSGSKKKGG